MAALGSSFNILIGDIGPSLRCSVIFGSISSQRPKSFFRLALPSRSMTHKHTDISMDMTRERISSPLIQKICSYLSILASALSDLQWLVQSLRELQF